MPVLMIAEISGQTREGYEGIRTALAEPMRLAPGFLLHTAHPVDGGWRVIEVWRSKAEADAWFATYVAPNIPHGIVPKRSYQELHSVLAP